MRNGRRAAAALAVTALALIGPAGAQAAESFYGVTASNRLVTFNSDTPGAIRSGVPITGLADSDTGIQGIDVRPADGALYGVGSAGILYRIDPATGVSTQIGLGFGLSGRSFGVDFNPVADRLRVVSDSGQNLRVNPLTGGATTDRALAYAAGDRNAGKAPSVVGAAYTNNAGDPRAVRARLRARRAGAAVAAQRRRAAHARGARLRCRGARGLRHRRQRQPRLGRLQARGQDRRGPVRAEHEHRAGVPLRAPQRRGHLHG